ncbi:MAG: radical SAM protein [Paludibacter sp.]|nr:radical SAM protein [Paludibacter sp.]
MKVLFIYSLDDVQSSRTPMRSWESIQLGISYISSFLKANKHQTQLLVLGSNQWKVSTKLLKTAVDEFDPNLICLTTIQSQYFFIKEIASLIKKQWPEKYVIVGGAYPTLSPEDVISGSFDALCIGEGEYPTLELCNQLASGAVPQGIANLWIKSADGTIEKNKTRDFLLELDILPFPDREMWKPWIREQLNDRFSVLLGRGCPYECAYCSNHAFRKVAPGKYVRMRSVESIIKEISMVNENHPLPRMYFEVESIAINKKWMLELCDQLEKFNQTLPSEITYGCNFRITPDSIDEALFVALRKANIRQINIGLESGNAKIRGEVLKRYYSNEDFLKVVSLARKHDLKVLVFNMIGLPGETLSSHKDTVLLNRQCQPDKHFTQVFYPYQGTELYDVCVKNGYIKDDLAIQIERRQSVIDLPNFSKAEIKKAYYLFNYNVYKGHKPLWKIIIMVIMVVMAANPTSNLLFRKVFQYPLIRKIRLKLLSVYDFNI